MVVWVIVRLRRGRRANGPTSDEDGADGDVEITPLRSTDQWRAEAERLEAAGRWREALRARYRSVIGLLIDRQLLADLPGRTPGEHRVELAEAVPTAAPPFDAATSLFESAWYGDEPTDAGRPRALPGAGRRRSRPRPSGVGDDERADERGARAGHRRPVILAAGRHRGPVARPREDPYLRPRPRPPQHRPAGPGRAGRRCCGSRARRSHVGGLPDPDRPDRLPVGGHA